MAKIFLNCPEKPAKENFFTLATLLQSRGYLKVRRKGIPGYMR